MLLRVAPGGGIEGYIDSTGESVFTVTVDTSGEVTLTQLRALHHTDDTNSNEPLSLTDSHVTLTRTDTITDGDGDTGEAEATVNVGASLVFLDDGPQADAGQALSLQIDETYGMGTYALTQADVFAAFPTPVFGNDGEGASPEFALVGTPGALTGWWISGQSDAGQELQLVKVSDTEFELRAGGAGGSLALTVSIDALGGEVLITQHVALHHPVTTDHNEPIALVGLISVQRTVFDGDGDSASQLAALNIEVLDDGPQDLQPAPGVLSNTVGADATFMLDQDGEIALNVGADAPGTVTFNPSLDGVAATNSAGDPLYSSGLPMTYSLSAGGTVLTASNALGPVFTVTLDAGAATYTVAMLATVDGGEPAIDFSAAGGYNFVGGNASWAGFNTVSDDNSKDLLLTPMTNGASGGTVNTNAASGGISAGASVGTNETLRVDFVNDLGGTPVSGGDFATTANQTQSFDGHYNTNGATAAIGVGGGAGTTTTINISAYDDSDSGVLKEVGDGSQDTIVAVSIIQGSESVLVLVS
ncbi:MAG: DUF5801 repeats-in-toxin domain-containing protein, partial [Phenylobacterium sp.]|uniref:DUF5801 repeats-in-toxin domain-containing protein n=1 Tax=Phenylobacterium sp. TaxID=1871053 RepID=UPI002735974F